jgi:hypothetical protein
VLLRSIVSHVKWGVFATLDWTGLVDWTGLDSGLIWIDLDSTRLDFPHGMEQPCIRTGRGEGRGGVGGRAKQSKVRPYRLSIRMNAYLSIFY